MLNLKNPELNNQLLEAGLRLADEETEPGFWLFVTVAGKPVAVWVTEDTGEEAGIRKDNGLVAGIDY